MTQNPSYSCWLEGSSGLRLPALSHHRRQAKSSLEILKMNCSLQARERRLIYEVKVNQKLGTRKPDDPRLISIFTISKLTINRFRLYYLVSCLS